MACGKPYKDLHHVDPAGPATVNNARCLCKDCHQETSSYGQERSGGMGKKKEFPSSVKFQREIVSNGQCECKGCFACDPLEAAMHNSRDRDRAMALLETILAQHKRKAAGE